MSNINILQANRQTIEKMKSKGSQYIKTLIQEITDSGHSQESKEAFLKLLYKALKEMNEK